MAIKMSDVAAEYKRARKQCHPNTIHVLRVLLLRGLSGHHRHALYLMPLNGTITTMEIASRLDLSLNHAGNIMARLRDLHLVEGTPVISDGGLHYEWREIAEGFDYKEKNHDDE